MVQINIKVGSKRARDVLGRLKKVIRNPVTKDDREKMRGIIISEINDVDGEQHRTHPYHTYPNVYGRDLEQSVFVKNNGTNGVSIGANSEHAGILETGRGQMLAQGKRFTFKGFYPNTSIIAALIGQHGKTDYFAGKRLERPQSGLAMEALETYKVGKAKRYIGAKGMTAEAPHVSPAMQSYRDALASRSKKKLYRANTRLIATVISEAYLSRDIERGKYLASQYGVPTTYAERIQNPSANKHIYGIWTVYANHLRHIPEYRAFTRAALKCAKHWRNSLEGRIARVEGLGRDEIIR
jgi:hypothetical protein